MSEENEKENDSSTQKIQIDVNNEATEELVKMLKEREAKEKEAKEKGEQKEFDLSEKKLQVYHKFNDSACLDCETKEQLAEFVTAKINDAAQKSRKAPSGSAPMNEHQFPTGDRLKFSSYEEMIRYCRAHKDEVVAENGFTGDDVLRVMLGRAVQSLKSGQEIKGYNPDANVQTKSGDPQVTLYEGMKNNPNSDLQQFLERGREHYRQQIMLQREHALELEKKRAEQKKGEEK